ncbi:MAG: ribonuclease III domain-containing protein [Lachnospiraceae bacterium]|nr:ribonuclease III [Lachnospiraceae bacterium]MEE0686386.1 ribonuclease III domain-containing protein [Lachnospiraceae bacterium]MEE0861886.1 ribonuclease III domain-containing protein [Lachnospiraceae bacterium]
MENGIGLYNFIFDKLKMEGMGIEKQDICSYSPLTLAYIGDGVYELVVRSMIVTEANAPVNKLHKRSSELVKAETQAKMALHFRDNDLLSEEELRVLKRGRNAQSYTKAKNASVSDYRWATGFEALIGYLYLSDKNDRMLEIIAMGLKIIMAD